MGIISNFNYVSLGDLEDPDDYRPNSFLSFNVDSGEGEKRVEQMVVFRERIAPGDQIPLHKHSIEEVMMIDEGTIKVRLGTQEQEVQAGSVIFIPAHELHGFQNTGESMARITAVFPSRFVDIFYKERNPLPGTENEAPQPPVRIDIRALSEGNVEEAVEIISKSEFKD